MFVENYSKNDSDGKEKICISNKSVTGEISGRKTSWLRNKLKSIDHIIDHFKNRPFSNKQTKNTKDSLFILKENEIEDSNKNFELIELNQNKLNKEELNQKFIKACCNNDINDVSLLLAQGGDVNYQDDSYTTPLMYACVYGDEILVKRLIESGAKVNLQDDSGSTALRMACEIGNEKIVRLLLDVGSDVNVFDNENRTILMHVFQDFSANENIIQQLIDAGADVNLKDRKGQTVLMQACEDANEQAIEFLLNLENINVNEKNNEDLTAIDFIDVYSPLADILISRLFEKGAYATLNKRNLTRVSEAKFNQNNYKALEIFKAYDFGISDIWIEQKMLAQRFGFNIFVDFLNKSKIKLVGLFSKFTYPILMDSFKKFQNTPEAKKAQESLKDWNENDWNSVILSVEKAVENFHKIPSVDEPGIFAFPLGWEGHATGIVISGDILIKCNRGEGSGSSPGLQIFKMGNKSEIQKVLSEAVENKNLAIGKEFFTTTINQKLELEPEFQIFHKDQHSGNCPWASAKLVLKAVIYLQLRSKGIGHEVAAEGSETLYRAWFNYDREQSIKEALITRKEILQNTTIGKEIKQQLLEISEAILKEVLSKCIIGKPSQSRDVIFECILSEYPEWANSATQFRNQYGLTLLAQAVLYGRINKVQTLLKYKANVNVVDGRGDSILKLARNHSDAKKAAFMIGLLMLHGA